MLQVSGSGTALYENIPYVEPGHQSAIEFQYTVVGALVLEDGSIPASPDGYQCLKLRIDNKESDRKVVACGKTLTGVPCVTLHVHSGFPNGATFEMAYTAPEDRIEYCLSG